jgi:hypothetical protein
MVYFLLVFFGLFSVSMLSAFHTRGLGAFSVTFMLSGFFGWFITILANTIHLSATFTGWGLTVRYISRHIYVILV